MGQPATVATDVPALFDAHRAGLQQLAQRSVDCPPSSAGAPRGRGVRGSPSPSHRSRLGNSFLAKVGVASSSLVFRSKLPLEAR